MSLFEKRGDCNIANFQNTPISEINIINKELVHSTSKRDEFCFNDKTSKLNNITAVFLKNFRKVTIFCSLL
jgi:hypothetical protein